MSNFCNQNEISRAFLLLVSQGNNCGKFQFVLVIASKAFILISTRIIRQFTIGAHNHKLVCRIDISDNGAGIPDDLQDKIFVPMVSGHASNSGLGLSIAQSIVNQHHGLIAFTSEVGNTCFSIYLPLEQHG